MIIYGLLAGLVILLGGMITLYNRMVAMRRLTENAWSDVDVFLKQRSDLVPSLVTVVKATASHEHRTLEEVSERRALAGAAPSLPARAEAEQQLGTGLQRVLVIAESYPTLRADSAFLNLQTQLIEIERHLADARKYYNACVRDYNVMIEAFPGSLVAGTAGLRPKEFFEIETLTEREAPQLGSL